MDTAREPRSLPPDDSEIQSLFTVLVVLSPRFCPLVSRARGQHADAPSLSRQSMVTRFKAKTWHLIYVYVLVLSLSLLLSRSRSPRVWETERRRERRSREFPRIPRGRVTWRASCLFTTLNPRCFGPATYFVLHGKRCRTNLRVFLSRGIPGKSLIFKRLKPSRARARARINSTINIGLLQTNADQEAVQR